MEQDKPKTAMERRKEMAAKESNAHPSRAIFAIIMLVLVLAPIFLSFVGKF